MQERRAGVHHGGDEIEPSVMPRLLTKASSYRAASLSYTVQNTSPVPVAWKDGPVASSKLCSFSGQRPKQCETPNPPLRIRIQQRGNIFALFGHDESMSWSIGERRESSRRYGDREEEERGDGRERGFPQSSPRYKYGQPAGKGFFSIRKPQPGAADVLDSSCHKFARRSRNSPCQMSGFSVRRVSKRPT